MPSIKGHYGVLCFVSLDLARMELFIGWMLLPQIFEKALRFWCSIVSRNHAMRDRCVKNQLEVLGIAHKAGN
ncbi:MAG: hypothetical protein QS748_09725 [Candidatus Endonucleobacter bathymodioli]|uniref:Uncharacterized protein n=1 Tax=Candidatus Endonucleibacter bathymodioli TaxID=539814 RepID=A0AA90STA9_9GAMM|nr:hypothetical protein [Candidatus Endonucleobacter bathymodioli]